MRRKQLGHVPWPDEAVLWRLGEHLVHHVGHDVKSSDMPLALLGMRDGLHADLESLRAEHRKSGAALRDAQENYAAMQVVSEAVAGRLDGAIGELKILLKE